MFVAFEGVEGSGKSTLLASVAAALSQRGLEPLTTREPGGTPLGEAIRDLFLSRRSAISPMAEALLVNAARSQHVVDVVGPHLQTGGIVLCDRYVDSTLAYQGYGRGLDLTILRSICDAATGGVTPDVTFVIDVPVDVSRQRSAQRGGDADRVESEGDGFHQRVRQGFLALAATSGHVLLDGRISREGLLELALTALRDRIGASS